MTAPATEYPTMPRSAYARNLHDALNYQCAVNRILLASTRPKDRNPHGPLLTSDELVAMDAAFTMGVAPEQFAALLVERDRAAVAA